jgi:di/tricarboxylate transporter
MNQKTTRALAWYATNGAEFYLMYLWLFNDAQWARNLIMFWLIFILVSLLTATTITKIKKAIRKKGRSVPKELAYLCYGFGVALLAAHGEFLFAAILLLCSSLEICIFDGLEEFEELS